MDLTGSESAGALAKVPAAEWTVTMCSTNRPQLGNRQDSSLWNNRVLVSFDTALACYDGTTLKME